jgi:solute carrier family 35, member C2
MSYLSLSGLKNPITLMCHVTPVMAIATLVLSLLLDPWSDFQKNAYFDDPWHVIRSCLLILIGGTLAFFMVMSVFMI